MQHSTLSVRFELKSLSDSGEFTGTASPYGVRDLGNDIADPGCFTKTIAERGDKVRLLDSHEVRIGIARVWEADDGLECKGKINLEKQAGRDAYSDLKFYQENGLPMGLSIGYQTIKAIPASESKDGARHLKEVRLWEISITEFPMNERALVSDVKHSRPEDRNMEQKMDFNEALDNVQTWGARYNYMQALDAAITSVMYDEKLTTDECAQQIAASCDQFRERMIELCPKLRALMNETYGFDFKQLFEAEKKAGRRLSAASRSKIEDAMKQLQALLDEEAAEEDGKAAGQTDLKGTPAPEAAAPSTEPVDHSKLSSLIENTKGAFVWKS